MLVNLADNLKSPKIRALKIALNYQTFAAGDVSEDLEMKDVCSGFAACPM